MKRERAERDHGRDRDEALRQLSREAAEVSIAALRLARRAAAAVTDEQGDEPRPRSA